MADKKLKFDYDLPSRNRRLLDFFTFGIFKRKDGKEHIYLNPERVKNAKKSAGRIILPADKFPTPIQRMLDKWAEVTTYNLDKWEGRKDLINDLLEMYYNSPIVSKAMNITVDEVLQADSNNQIIGVEGNKRQVDYINKKLDDWGIQYILRDIAFNIVLTGDYGLIPKIGKNGVEKVSTIEPLDLQDIFEFRPIDFADLENPSHSGGQNDSYLNRYKSLRQVNRIEELINAIKTNSDLSDAFDRHTLGYMVKDQIVPPWGFIHFRNYSSQSPFKPFGLPPFIHCLAPFRQLQLANQLQMSARASRFPIQRFKIKLPNIMMPTDKLEKAIEFINELDNSGFYSTKKETPGVGERLITIDELFEVDLMEYQIDLGRIDDIEALRDDLMNATLLPKSVVDPNVSGLGASGVSLIQQFKPFSRFVYGIQSVILEGLTKLIQIDMILSNSFSEDEMDFILTMPFPESQTDRELIGSQSDLIQLANTVLDILGQRFYGDPSAVLPEDLVKSVLTQILPYDKNRLDDWIALINAGRKVMDDEEGEEDEEMAENTKKIKKMDKGIIRESIQEAKLEAFKSKGLEYKMSNRHYHRSVLGTQNHNFNTKVLIEMKKNSMKTKLKEEGQEDGE
jgi:hypothetical protein